MTTASILIAFSFDHFAIVGVAARFEVILFNKHRPGFVEVTGIDIHDGNDVLADHSVYIFSRSICGSYAGDVELFQQTARGFCAGF